MMETFTEKLLRYVRIWLLIALAVLIGSIVTHWDAIAASFSAHMGVALIGTATLALTVVLFIYMIRARG